MDRHRPAPTESSRARRPHRALAAAAAALVLAAPAVGEGASAAPAGESAESCAAAVASTMTLEQRVGQLFMVGIDARSPSAAQLALVHDRRLGGVLLTGRSTSGVAATRSVVLAARGRSGGAVSAGAALWVSTDQEGGAVQVLRGPGYSDIPAALQQGRLAPSELRRQAAEWGRQLGATGVDLDLAPVLDTVPASLGAANRPIGYYDREYAHDPAGVSASGLAFAAGMRDVGEETAAKHFPGLGRVLGNTDTTAGVTDDVTVRGDAYLRPFADAVHDGVGVVMVSSARYSRIDASTIATFSPVVLQQMLRGDLGFGGVIMSDSLGATALSGVPVRDRAVRFIQAGGTVALSAQSGIVGEMVDGVLARARSDAGFRAQVDAAARTELTAKARTGLVPCPAGTSGIAARYVELGGPASALGAAQGAVRPVGVGAVQDYAGGSIYWSPGTGAHVVEGEVLARYREVGGPAALGFPTTDTTATPDGRGRYTHFDGRDGASIYWTPTTGAHAIWGPIRTQWSRQGWEKGVLGYPVSDLYRVPGGFQTDFQGGSLTSPTG